MNNIQANDYERSDIMKESEKLYSRYRALVYRGPLQPQLVNYLITNRIQECCLLIY